MLVQSVVRDARAYARVYMAVALLQPFQDPFGQLAHDPLRNLALERRLNMDTVHADPGSLDQTIFHALTQDLGGYLVQRKVLQPVPPELGQQARIRQLVLRVQTQKPRERKADARFLYNLRV